ncbi:reductive dehalogenase, partial [Sansalvadorimonas verongulae]|uniref:reductive dehalogenase n=1 Tax=Sansalvadorimonas verongulae TaxID=2172824 RepID=UPI0012BCB268
MNDSNAHVPSKEPKIDRRSLLKLGAAGAATALVAGAPAVAQANSGSRGGAGVVTHDDLPVEVGPEYKRFDQYHSVFSRAGRRGIPNMAPYYDNDKPGFTIPDYAMSLASTTVFYDYLNNGLDEIHDATDALPEPYKFPSSAMAHAQIKRTARLFGADLVGITRRDERWDYSEVLHPKGRVRGEMATPQGGGVMTPGVRNRTLPWEEAMAGFNPKTVIVIGLEMEYEALRTAPSQIADATANHAYSELTSVVMHLSKFLNNLGYKSVPSVNRLGLNIPYGVAAGLGELNRMGTLQNYKYGTRFRLARVYTELELDEYFDKPVTFGVQDFCENCLHCADKCPSKAISHDDKPTMYTAEDVKGRPYMNPGVKKWYLDGQKCHDYWIESGTACGSCIATCPYNKPDFWHHRLIDRLNTLLPGPAHKFMAEMDLLHGYGKVFDEK